MNAMSFPPVQNNQTVFCWVRCRIVIYCPETKEYKVYVQAADVRFYIMYCPDSKAQNALGSWGWTLPHLSECLNKTHKIFVELADFVPYPITVLPPTTFRTRHPSIDWVCDYIRASVKSPSVTVPDDGQKGIWTIGGKNQEKTIGAERLGAIISKLDPTLFFWQVGFQAALAWALETGLENPLQERWMIGRNTSYNNTSEEMLQIPCRGERRTLF